MRTEKDEEVVAAVVVVVATYFLDIIYLERNAKFMNYTFCPVTTKSNK